MPALAEIGYGAIVRQQVRALVVQPTRLATRAARRLIDRTNRASAHHDCGCGH
jgi:hypothetical protein